MQHSNVWVDILLNKNQKEMIYSFKGITSQAEQSYDNTAAHSELKAIMNRSERLSLYFTIDRYGYEAIRVES